MSVLPTNPTERKDTPIFSGVMAYFPRALAEVARVSKAGNDQHNPGQPLHWDRTKSQDHKDCIARHLLEAGTRDTDGQLHSGKLAWRALANLEIELERADMDECDMNVGPCACGAWHGEGSFEPKTPVNFLSSGPAGYGGSPPDPVNPMVEDGTLFQAPGRIDSSEGVRKYFERTRPYRPLRVYVSGPYSAPPGLAPWEAQVARDALTLQAVMVSKAIAQRGHSPHCPHAATHDLHGMLSYDQFMDFDLTILGSRMPNGRPLFDALFYIGASKGADMEKRYAELLGIPVITNIDDLPNLREAPHVK